MELKKEFSWSTPNHLKFKRTFTISLPETAFGIPLEDIFQNSATQNIQIHLIIQLKLFL